MTIDNKIILVVDDSNVCQGFIKLLFNKFPKYKILSVYNGQEAIETANQYYKDITLILLDLGLPDIPGLELYDIFQNSSKLKNIPVILQSGHNFDKSQLKVNDNLIFLLKPFSAEELFEKIDVLTKKTMIT